MLTHGAFILKQQHRKNKMSDGAIHYEHKVRNRDKVTREELFYQSLREASSANVN
jgi:hypothetical protein